MQGALRAVEERHEKRKKSEGRATEAHHAPGLVRLCIQLIGRLES
jgi:hypothetical protein